MRTKENPAVAPLTEVLPPVLNMTDRETEIIEDEEQRPHFIEGNSQSISLSDLKTKCIVPTWADNTLIISHQELIRSVHKAASDVFGGIVLQPEIRVSHPVLGRTPDALYKSPGQLLESEKTLFYQRLAFCIEISERSIINGNETRIIVGGIRALNQENLSTRPGPQKVKLFIGHQVTICCNGCIFGDYALDRLEVMTAIDIYAHALQLFQSFDPDVSRQRLETLGDTFMSTEDFTHIVGRMRLYEALPTTKRNLLGLPQITLGDQALNSATRGFVSNANFGIGDKEQITCWDFMNLLTEATKSGSSDISSDTTVMQCIKP